MITTIVMAAVVLITYPWLFSGDVFRTLFGLVSLFTVGCVGQARWGYLK